MPTRKMKSSSPLPDQMITQSRREQLKRLKDRKQLKKYEITIRSDARGSWKFTFYGHLSYWQGFLITLAGWDIREVG